jgi:hypothetical protein
MLAPTVVALAITSATAGFLWRDELRRLGPCLGKKVRVEDFDGKVPFLRIYLIK